MANTELKEQLYAWFRGLPPLHSMVWSHDMACSAVDVHTGRISVFTSEVCQATGSNRLVSIVAPGDRLAREADGFSVVIARHDTAVSVGSGEPDSLEQTPDKNDGTGSAGSNCDGQIRNGWSTAALNSALKGWANRVAGRYDIDWIFDDCVTNTAAQESTDRSSDSSVAA